MRSPLVAAIALLVCSSPAPAAETAPVAPGAPPQQARSVDDLRERFAEVKGIETSGDALALREAGPVWVEFRNSPLLSQAVADDLRARGFPIAASREEARSTLSLQVRVQLDGSVGRSYMDLGETFEKIAASDASVAEAIRRPAGAQQVDGLRDAALVQAWYGVGLFDKFLRNYFSVAALSDVVGARAGFNRLIAGDPRGFCLTNCEHWRHIHHRTLIFAKLSTDGRELNARAESKIWMKTVDPQPAFDFTFEHLVQSKF